MVLRFRENAAASQTFPREITHPFNFFCPERQVEEKKHDSFYQK